MSQSARYIPLVAVIAPLEYFSLKMCHLTGPQAHYESPCSQLSEPPCLEATVTKKADREMAHPQI